MTRTRSSNKGKSTTRGGDEFSNQSGGEQSNSGSIASHGSGNSSHSGRVYRQNLLSGKGAMKKKVQLKTKFSYSEGFFKELKDKVEFVEFTRFTYKSCPEIPLINLTTKEGSQFCIVNTVNLGMCIVGTQHNQFDVIRCNSISSEYYSSRRGSQTELTGVKVEKERSEQGSESSSIHYRTVLSQASLGTSIESDSKEGSNNSLKGKGMNMLTLNPEKDIIRARPGLRFSSSSDLEEESLGPAPSLLHDAISAVYEKHPDKFYESMHALLRDVSPFYNEQFCSDLTRRLCRVQDERGEPRDYMMD